MTPNKIHILLYLGQHLRLTDLKPYDQGTYTCRAENRLGINEVNVDLTIEGREKPVEFITTPHDMSAPQGVTIQMPCSADGIYI